MKLSQFRFDLPLNLIAQNPAKKREDARMMVVHRHTGVLMRAQLEDLIMGALRKFAPEHVESEGGGTESPGGHRQAQHTGVSGCLRHDGKVS